MKLFKLSVACDLRIILNQVQIIPTEIKTALLMPLKIVYDVKISNDI